MNADMAVRSMINSHSNRAARSEPRISCRVTGLTGWALSDWFERSRRGVR